MTPLRTYHPNGKAHRMLERLLGGSATRAELRHVGADRPGQPSTNAFRRKVAHVLTALVADGYLSPLGDGVYALTRAGHDAWACLEAGHPVEIHPPAEMAAEIRGPGAGFRGLRPHRCARMARAEVFRD